jgi:hypothetical protein
MATTQTIARVLVEMRYLANSPMTDSNTKEIVNSYSGDLSDIPENLLDAAARHYRTTERFFPQAGALRQKAMELMVDAMDIPTAAEAWGYVLTAHKTRAAIDCEEGAELRRAIDGKAAGEYWRALWAHEAHIKVCGYCSRGGTAEDYQHPAVERTVQLLGGRSLLLTDNAAADRARFIQAYDEIVGREKRRAIMHREVKEFVDDTRALLEDKKSAFDTGERRQFTMKEMSRLGDGMKR